MKKIFRLFIALYLLSTIGYGSSVSSGGGGGGGVTDHGALTGLNDPDHDAVYFQESEFINSSAGVGDAGKPIALDASGVISTTMYTPGVANPLTSAAVITTNAIVVGSDGARGLAETGVLIDGSDNVSGVLSIDVNGLSIATGLIKQADDISGAGDLLTIQGADAFATSGLAGGDVVLRPGAGDGAGADGQISFLDAAGVERTAFGVNGSGNAFLTLDTARIDEISTGDLIINNGDTSFWFYLGNTSGGFRRQASNLNIAMAGGNVTIESNEFKPNSNLSASLGTLARQWNAFYNGGISYLGTADGVRLEISTGIIKQDDDLSGAGDTLVITGANGFATSAGAGGNITITAGAGGSTDGNGGNLILAGGAPDGSGIVGVVTVNSDLVVTKGLITSSVTVDLLADNTVIVVLDTTSFILITSDSATSTARSFSLSTTNVTAGHRVVIVQNEDPSTGASEILNTGNMKNTKTVGTITGVLDTTMAEYIFDGTNWIEL